MNGMASWDEVFLDMCRAVARRSKDPSSKHGSVIVDARNRVCSVGFNGPPPRIPDNQVPFDVRPDKYKYVVHAEENAILFGLAGRGIDGLMGTRLYVTGRPCSGCVLRAVHAGVESIRFGGIVSVCTDDADWETAQRLARLGGLLLHPLDPKPIT